MDFPCFRSSFVVHGLFNLCFLQLLRKQHIQLNTLNFLGRKNFDNSLSNMFPVCDCQNIFNLFLSYFRLLAVFNFWLFRPLWFILELFGTFPPFIIKLKYFTTSAPKVGWIFFIATYFHSIKLFPLILVTLLLTNVLYSLTALVNCNIKHISRSSHREVFS